MKSSLSTLAILALGFLVTTPALAEPTAGPPVQAHGGGGKGTLPAINDLEFVAISRVEEGLARQITAANNARNLVAATVFTLPLNNAELAARLKGLSDAELALAYGQSEAAPILKAELVKLKIDAKSGTPERMQVLARQIGNAASGGGRGGAAPAAPAALGGRGGAVNAPAGPARGN